MKTITVPIKGMHCRSCELVVEGNLGKVAGVICVRVSQKRGEAVVEHAGDAPDRSEMEAAVRASGYEVGRSERPPLLARDAATWQNLGLAALAVSGAYLLFSASGLGHIPANAPSAGPAVALGIGLIAGFSTCTALVGGLVLAFSARHAALHPEATGRQKFLPHLWFNLGRVVGFGLLGGLLGAVGGILKPSPFAIATLTVLVGAVMIALGARLTGISPRLSAGGPVLPSGIARRLGLHRSSEYSPRAAAVAGTLTFFLPCGFTQAMQVASVGAGSFGGGAVLMSAFAVGTAPALLGIGGLAALMKGRAGKLFTAAAGLAVLAFGVVNISNGLAAAGFQAKTKAPADITASALMEREVQVIRVTQGARGYSPNRLTVRAGVPVRLIVTSETTYSCASSFVMPTLGVSRDLRLGENVIEFTPTAPGVVPFSCSMGMYRGQIEVTAGATAK